jgi:predicted ATPase
MIKEIRYKNYKALRDTTLPLGQFTLIVGANGTGKTTAMKALKDIDAIIPADYETFISKGLSKSNTSLEIEIAWEDFAVKRIANNHSLMNFFTPIDSDSIENASISLINLLSSAFSRDYESNELRSFRLFSFDSDKIRIPTQLSTHLELSQDGGNLAGILDQLRDMEPERFEALNIELSRWFPEYDRILFEVPNTGYRAFLLRTKIGQHKIKAEDLSDGTRLALAYLTIAYLPNPPKIVCFEEPERGIHPRLLNNIQEAMYRLAFPANYGENREPIQVVATTHSPYLLDLYKDNPEEIVIAEKDENGVHFQNLSKMKNIDKILQGGESLGEVWFTGILGGVPALI